MSRMQLEMLLKVLTHRDLVILQMLHCSKASPETRELIQAWIPKPVPTALWATSATKLQRTFQTRPRTKRVILHAIPAIGPETI